MKQIIIELVIAFAICWSACFCLAGCAVDEREVYNLITNTKSEPETPWVARIPKRHTAMVNKK